MKTPAIIIATVAAASWAAPASARTADWATASNVARDILVSAALGVPAIKGDWHGDIEAGESLIAAGATTFALKELIHERRPDGSDRKSFPSGHTSIAFASAMTLEKRYGWQVGLPAFAMASFVGLARVRADKHYVHDVLAGGVVGTLSGFLLTSKRDDQVMLSPWAGYKTGGVSVALRF